MYDVRKSELDIDVETLSEEEKIRDASEMKDGVASLGKYLVQFARGFAGPFLTPAVTQVIGEKRLITEHCYMFEYALYLRPCPRSE